MAAITFDTHEFIKSLTDSGMPEAQAEALVHAHQHALSQALDTAVDTKGGIADLKADAG